MLRLWCTLGKNILRPAGPAGVFLAESGADPWGDSLRDPSLPSRQHLRGLEGADGDGKDERDGTGGSTDSGF